MSINPLKAKSRVHKAPKKRLAIIGNNAFVTIAGIKHIPAKVDTGADSSSVWASDIEVNSAGQLEFSLFGPGYPLYTGERIAVAEFSVQQVRNSTGDIKLRYRVPLIMKVKNRKIQAFFTLADRSRNRFPVLIGRKTLQNKFLVDVSKVAISRPSTFNNNELVAELARNPQKFHQKYMQKGQK